MFLAGIYVSSMSSCLGAMYGTPRVLQSIANERVIPLISVLGHGVRALNGFRSAHSRTRESTRIIIYSILERSEQDTGSSHVGDRDHNYRIYSEWRYKYVGAYSNDAIPIDVGGHGLRVFCLGADLRHSTST